MTTPNAEYVCPISDAEHARLDAEWHVAFDALRAAGLEADADHPVAKRYRVRAPITTVLEGTTTMPRAYARIEAALETLRQEGLIEWDCDLVDGTTGYIVRPLNVTQGG